MELGVNKCISDGAIPKCRTRRLGEGSDVVREERGETTGAEWGLGRKDIEPFGMPSRMIPKKEVADL